MHIAEASADRLVYRCREHQSRCAISSSVFIRVRCSRSTFWIANRNVWRYLQHRAHRKERERLIAGNESSAVNGHRCVLSLPGRNSHRSGASGRSHGFAHRTVDRKELDEWLFVAGVASMSRPLFSTRAGRLSLWLGGAGLALLGFVRITTELIEGDVSALDSAILLTVAKTGTPWLTIAAVDVTALGSITLVVLFSAFTLVVLLVLRDRMGALQLLAASAGAGILTLVTKDIIERIRPAEVPRLIVVSGFSYPSGHSLSTSALYLTIAIIAGTLCTTLRAQGPQFFWPCQWCLLWLAPLACTLAFIMRLTSRAASRLERRGRWFSLDSSHVLDIIVHRPEYPSAHAKIG